MRVRYCQLAGSSNSSSSSIRDGVSVAGLAAATALLAARACSIMVLWSEIIITDICLEHRHGAMMHVVSVGWEHIVVEHIVKVLNSA